MIPEITKDDKVAVLVGSEGYVGHHILAKLVGHGAYAKIRLISGRMKDHHHDKVEIVRSSIEQIDPSIFKADDLFICYDRSFFNTGGKFALPASSYRHLPHMIRQASASIGQVILLSSKQADKDGVRTTSRIRGLIEETVAGQQFWSTHIFRPSLLLGETLPNKWGEQITDRIGSTIDRYTGGWLRRNKPIAADVVASAMIEVAQKIRPGIHYYSSSWLQDYENASSSKDLRK